MNIQDVKFGGAALIKPDIYGDDRGYYSPVLIAEAVKDLGFNSIVQVSRSKSLKGIARGLHFLTGNFNQAKIVEVLSGEVLDIIVDLNNNSSTYGKIGYFHLKPEDKLLYIPHGFAHGFISLKDDTIFQYYVDNDYAPLHESGINIRSEFDNYFKHDSISNIFDPNYLRLFDITKIQMNERDLNFDKFDKGIRYF